VLVTEKAVDVERVEHLKCAIYLNLEIYGALIEEILLARMSSEGSMSSSRSRESSVTALMICRVVSLVWTAIPASRNPCATKVGIQSVSKRLIDGMGQLGQSNATKDRHGRVKNTN
jgi:hypothetical protein